MQILQITPLSIPEVKIVSFARFSDNRGYFTESYNINQFDELKPALGDFEVKQINESFSHPMTVRGLHFQWNPFMGKLVRTLYGHMIDLVLDIRLNSPTYGKIIAHDMPARNTDDRGEYIWVPPGFAHGNFFLEETMIEYLCTGTYSKGCEACISAVSLDLDWSLCPKPLYDLFSKVVFHRDLKVSEKDRAGFSLKQWTEDERSKNFIYGEL